MKDNIKDAQLKILEIIGYIDRFCNENGIEYYLMGGSALGAIRHEGFIPWDDDLDIFMTYENYIKFINCCEKKLDREKFFLQKENTKEWPMFFSKVRMNGTTFIEEDTKNREMHKGIYVDVMCLNNAANNDNIRYLQFLAARVLTARTLVEKGYKTNNKSKIITMYLARIIINGPIKNGLVKFVRSFNGREKRKVGHFFGRAKFINTSFEKSWLGKGRYVKFENIKLPVMENVEEYLDVRYGSNYMEIPSQEEKDKYPSHAIIIDINKNYTEYNDFLDR